MLAPQVACDRRAGAEHEQSFFLADILICWLWRSVANASLVRIGPYVFHRPHELRMPQCGTFLEFIQRRPKCVDSRYECSCDGLGGIDAIFDAARPIPAIDIH